MILFSNYCYVNENVWHFCSISRKIASRFYTLTLYLIRKVHTGSLLVLCNTPPASTSFRHQIWSKDHNVHFLSDLLSSSDNISGRPITKETALFKLLSRRRWVKWDAKCTQTEETNSSLFSCCQLRVHTDGPLWSDTVWSHIIFN